MRAADITIRVPPLHHLPILSPLLLQLFQLSSSLRDLEPSMWVALTIGFFGMLCQSNLAPSSPAHFDRSRHTCQGDIIQAPRDCLSSFVGPKPCKPWPPPQFSPCQLFLAILWQLFTLSYLLPPPLLLITPFFLITMVTGKWWSPFPFWPKHAGQSFGHHA